MNRPINRKFWTAYDSGRFRDALLGSADLLTPGHTDRAHDRPLAIRQLLWWAADRDAWEDAAAGFLGVVKRLKTSEDAPTLFDLLWCYALATKDLHEVLPVPKESLHAIAAEASERCRVTLEHDPAVKAQAGAVLEAFST